MRRTLPEIVLLAAASALLGGCQAPPKADGPTEAIVEISDRDAFCDRMLTVLREHDLNPDLVDREQGVAITEPSTSGQWFEVWRSDVHGGYQIAESSMHTIRRQVRVEWQPVAGTPVPPAPSRMSRAASSTGNRNAAAPPNQHRLAVQVEKERFSSPERQVTSASGALGIYSERLPTREGLLKARVRGDHWVPLGRDVLLERHLLAKLTALAPLPGEAVPEDVAPSASTRPARGQPEQRPAPQASPAPQNGRPAMSPASPPAQRNAPPPMGVMQPVRGG